MTKDHGHLEFPRNQILQLIKNTLGRCRILLPWLHLQLELKTPKGSANQSKTLAPTFVECAKNVMTLPLKEIFRLICKIVVTAWRQKWKK